MDFNVMKSKYYDTADLTVPHNYYPRPQLRRDSFLCLNGSWDFCQCKEGETPTFGERILVPFCVESLLSGITRSVEKGDILHYRRSFTLPEGFRKERVILHFGAVDQICRVYLGDRLVGENFGGYLPFSIDITEALTDGENILRLEVKDDLDQRYPYGKQSKKRGGIWYTPTSGIWQTVWLESLPESFVEGLVMSPDTEGVDIRVTGGVGHKKITLTESGEVFEFDSDTVRITPASVRLWSPEDPYLYYFTLECGEDRIESYFALRTVDVRCIDGKERICLNGAPYIFNGMLDQGYYSDGLYTPPDIRGFVDDIRLTKSLGFNMLRKHIKVEPMIFYHLCDVEGIAVFQDMVNNGVYRFFHDSALPTIALSLQRIGDKRYNRDPEGRRIFEDCMYRTAEHLHNCPSVVYYTIFNEGWGQFCADEMYEKLKARGTGRILDSTSGWFRKRLSDVDSRHIYWRPLKFKRPTGKAQVMSEYGGYSYRVSGHLFCEANFGYKSFEGPEALEDAVVKLLEEQVLPLAEAGVGAFVYTQLSDVEEETNGVVTYDRQVVKVGTDRIRAANERIIAAARKVKN
ncbi:MAG: glycoside hydrolase family 2 [Clostridia bacterium]|nr:glycoside hydrolase family 2 [Clostridia bacterium]